MICKEMNCFLMFVFYKHEMYLKLRRLEVNVFYRYAWVQIEPVIKDLERCRGVTVEKFPQKTK